MRFKGEDKNEIIDWETAKGYAVQVMEFFGARTVWTNMNNIIDPEALDEFQVNAGQERGIGATENTPSTSQLDNCPNDIEFAK